MKPAVIQFTLVQHSAAGYKGDPRFMRAVQLETLTGAKDAARVKKAGGLLFDSWTECDEREEAENYPPEVMGLIPRCKGSFSKVKVGGLKVYVPPPLPVKA